MAEFPAPAEGIVLTHFIVVSDVDRARRSRGQGCLNLPPGWGRRPLITPADGELLAKVFGCDREYRTGEVRPAYRCLP